MAGATYVLLTVSTVVFWGMLIAGGGVAFRYLNRMPVNPGNGETRPTPEQLLGERFARGGIDAEDYRQRLDTAQRLPSRQVLTTSSCTLAGQAVMGRLQWATQAEPVRKETVTWMSVIRPPVHVRRTSHPVGPHSGRLPLFGQLLPDDRPSGPVAAGRGDRCPPESSQPRLGS